MNTNNQDYAEAIISIMSKIKNKSLLKRVYNLAEYLYIHVGRCGRKATTCTNYKSYYNTYIKDTIGKKQIAKITKADCQRIINEMVQDGKKHSTMSNLKSCLNIVFECALDDDSITKIPANNLQVPQTESKKRTAMCCLIQA